MIPSQPKEDYMILGTEDIIIVIFNRPFPLLDLLMALVLLVGFFTESKRLPVGKMLKTVHLWLGFVVERYPRNTQG